MSDGGKIAKMRKLADEAAAYANDGPPREPTKAMINAIHSIHRPGWAVSWHTVWTTMYDAWNREREK